MPESNRRKFLKTLALGAAGVACAPQWVRAANSAASPSGPLKGFIVADAHLGWQTPRQPSPDKQREMLRRILTRFPDLDVFIDTGDAHHNGWTSAQPLEEWTEIFLEGCGPIPFLYVPGNHEIASQKDDAEWRCETMGSLACRPYYAVDLKNIHLVSFPELIRTTLLTKEQMEWLRLDLEVNKEKSIILLSHNNIRGTTSDNGEDGYRGLVNSHETLDLLTKCPNVLAWMHGHNHMYQIVEQAGKLFVSNGRIGGFDLAKQGRPGEPLGGIYFEVGAEGLTVRCYSAEDDRSLDEVRGPGFSRTLRAATSFDPTQPPSATYGRGGAPDGERIPVMRHWGGGLGTRELFVTGAGDPVLNDDPEFRLYMTRNAGKPNEDRQLSVGGVAPANAWEWADPGLRLLARKGRGEATTVFMPRPGAARFLYYRCPPGVRLVVEVTLESPTGGQTVKPRCLIHDRAGQQLATLDCPGWTLGAGSTTHRAEVKLPPLAEAATIYADPQSDNLVHVSFALEFRGLSEDVVVRRFAFQRAGADGTTRDAAVLEDGARYAHKGELAPGQVARFDLPPNPPARSVFEARAGGAARLTWLVRETSPRWQVRNALAAEKDGQLEIGPLRNPYSVRREILIAPLAAKDEVWVSRLRNVNRARVSVSDAGRLRIELVDLLGPAEIEIVAPRSPRSVEGTDNWRFENGRIIASVARPTTVQIDPA